MTTVARLCLLAFLGLQALGSPARADADRPWIVAAVPNPPFVIQAADGSHTGLAVALWEAIARDLGIDYEIRPYPQDAVWDALERGEVDLAIGDLDVTAEREHRVDFTHPFEQGGLGIATRGGPDLSLRDDLAGLGSPRVVRILGLALLLLLGASTLVWLFERNRNPEHFAHDVRGLGDGLWWSAVTMSTVGYGDKTPRTPAGRALAMFWILASLVLVAALSGAVASAFTVVHLRHTVTSPGDLAHLRVAAVAGSVGAGWLDARGLRYRPVADTGAALDLLASGGVDAVVDDEPVLAYFIHAHQPEAAHLAPVTMQEEDYAFALPPGSPHREAISAALLEVVQGDAWPPVRRFYLGE